MDNNEIKAIVTAERRAALGSNTNSDLQKQRSDAQDYYMGDMDEHMPVHEGGSRAVSSDVADIVETLLPSLLDVFMGSDNVVEFPPKGEEDVEAAAQETDVVNHIFWNDNAGFMTMYSFIKDALISKVGIVKIWWEEVEDAEKESYEGLDEEGYIALFSDPEIEIVEQTFEEEGISVKVQKRSDYGKIRIEPVPPEEFGIAHEATSIADSHYCFHTYEKSRSDLIAQGYDKKVVDNLPTGGEVDGEEEYARNTVEHDTFAASTVNKALAKVEITEHYIKLDRDEDGIAELLQVITAGTQGEILSIEEIDRMPFASICPIPITHRFFGKSIADISMDIQRIKTHLYRSLLDNASLLNNQRIAVGETGASASTIDDLLTNRPGGIVRMKDISQLREIPNQQIGPHIMPLMEYTDQARETRTGVTRHSMGLDPDSLNKASGTATGFNGLMDASMMRIKTIARIFAETGIKDLFIHIHELLRKHQQQEINIKIRNKWTFVKPRSWKTRNDMAVTVGLGTGTKEKQLMVLNNILERQIQAIQFQGGVEGPLVTLENVRATLAKITELGGFRDAEIFFKEIDPEQMQQQPEQPSPEMLEMQAEQQQNAAKLQLEQQKAQADIQLQREKADAQIRADREKAQAQIEAMREKASAELTLAREKAVAELELARDKMAMEGKLAEEKMGMEAEIAVHKNVIAGEVKLSSNRPGGSLSE